MRAYNAPHRLLWRGNIFTATASPLASVERTCRLTTQTQQRLFVVNPGTASERDTQALANEIVARIERDFARTNRLHLATRFIERRRDTPLAVLRRVLYSAYLFAFSA
jgi:hypothetical protein